MLSERRLNEESQEDVGGRLKGMADARPTRVGTGLKN